MPKIYIELYKKLVGDDEFVENKFWQERDYSTVKTRYLKKKQCYFTLSGQFLINLIKRIVW